jgi:hypothetical protein
MPRFSSPQALLASALLAASGLSLSACRNSGPQQMTKPDIHIKERESPQKAHRIEMVIENAPGPFAVVEGAAHYNVSNHYECGYIDPVPGVASRISTSPPIVWTRIGEGRYEATVYEDLIVDEDYYGRGVCRWEFEWVTAMLKATGAEGETRFLPSIPASRIIQGEIETLFFWSGYYLDGNTDNFPDYGQKHLSKVPENQKSEFFMVSVKRKAVQP